MKKILRNNANLLLLSIVCFFFFIKKDELIFNFNTYELISGQIKFLIMSVSIYFMFSFFINVNYTDWFKRNLLICNILLLSIFFILNNAHFINNLLQSTEKQLLLLNMLIPFSILFIVSKLLKGSLNLIKKISLLRNNIYSKKSKLNTLVHEIGHATLLAYLEKDLIIDTNIKIANVRLPFIPYSGRLNIVAKKFEIYDNKKFFEWNMLKSLAGNISEQCIMNKNPMYDGTSEDSDYTYWKNLAKQYLSSGFSGLYYPNPKNDEEIKTNIISMNQLKNEQEEILRELFLSNKDIINNFANEHLNKKINKKEIFDLCEKLIKIEKIPEIKQANFIN